MVLLLVRSRGGSDLHWLVVRFRGGLLEPTAGYSRSKDSALLLLRMERGRRWVTGGGEPFPSVPRVREWGLRGVPGCRGKATTAQLQHHQLFYLEKVQHKHHFPQPACLGNVYIK